MLQAKLKVVGGRHHGRVIPLATKKFLIGREQDCHLRPNSELVSRHHCVFSVDDFSVHVRDLGSTNGTFVNDQRVRGEILLNTGDRIRVGKLDFEMVIGEPLAAAGPRKGTGDSSQLLPGLTIDGLASETAPLGPNDTSFEIPVPLVPEDTGSSIIRRLGDAGAGRSCRRRSRQSVAGRFHGRLDAARFARPRLCAGDVSPDGDALSPGAVPALL